jgi:hypothetical protein
MMCSDHQAEDNPAGRLKPLDLEISTIGCKRIMKPETEEKFEKENDFFEKMFAFFCFPFVLLTGYFLIFHFL